VPQESSSSSVSAAGFGRSRVAEGLPDDVARPPFSIRRVGGAEAEVGLGAGARGAEDEEADEVADGAAGDEAEADDELGLGFGCGGGILFSGTPDACIAACMHV
jgi:hypothetical protein